MPDAEAAPVSHKREHEESAAQESPPPARPRLEEKAAEPPAAPEAAAPPPVVAKPGFGFGAPVAGFGFAAAAARGGFGGFAAAAAGGGGFGGGAAAAAEPVPPFGGKTGFGAAVAAGSDDEGEDAGDGGGSSPPAPDYKPLVSLPPEAPQVTGEEGETAVFSGQATLFAFEAPPGEPGAAPRPLTWRERGRGEVRCNVQHGTGEGGATTTARLVMRAAGNLRLILNAALFKGIVFTPLDGGKGVSFACVNAAEGGAGGEGGEGAAAGTAMGTFAVRLRGADADARGVTFKTALDKALREVLASQAAAAPAPPAGDEAV